MQQNPEGKSSAVPKVTPVSKDYVEVQVYVYVQVHEKTVA